jgi:hypothetical protein
MIRATILLALLGAGLLALSPEPDYDESCGTDTECMAFCPPPADDPECDGGPQDVGFNRGNFGSQP